jgi:anti-sigma regulatory factor (Ser/Thr protein kinase)
VRLEVRDWLERHGVGDGIVDDVVSALAEASSNAVDHGYQQDHVGQVAIDVALDDAVRVTVRDRGHWTQPMRRPDRGRGFVIMEGLMDEVVVDTSKDGTVVRLVKHLR